MYKFVVFLVLLLAISVSVESQGECGQFFCLAIGGQCLYHEQCDSTYCDLYSRADSNEYGNCAIPPPNWGHCKFESEDCTAHEECCTGNCYTLVEYNISYCNPPFSPPAPPIVFAPVPSPSLSPAPAATPPSPSAPAPPPVEDTPTSTLAPGPSNKKHKNRKLKHSKSHGQKAFAPSPC